MSEKQNYDDAVKIIKNAILQSQYEAARSVNEKQLMLYFGIGKFISLNSREGFWGEGAIDTISERLQKELPGLRGFSARNLRYMRTFYEEWAILDSTKNYNLELATANSSDCLLPTIWHTHVPNLRELLIEDFSSIGFSNHRLILSKVKELEARAFYVVKSAREKLSYAELERSIAADDFHHQSKLPNNFEKAISGSGQALKAISSFKDEYLLDFINVEEIGARDRQEVDERVVENSIIHNVKNFMASLVAMLLKAGRTDDLQKASTDPVYREQLFKEFGIA